MRNRLSQAEADEEANWQAYELYGSDYLLEGPVELPGMPMDRGELPGSSVSEPSKTSHRKRTIFEEPESTSTAAPQVTITATDHSPLVSRRYPGVPIFQKTAALLACGSGPETSERPPRKSSLEVGAKALSPQGWGEPELREMRLHESKTLPDIPSAEEETLSNPGSSAQTRVPPDVRTNRSEFSSREPVISDADQSLPHLSHELPSRSLDAALPSHPSPSLASTLDLPTQTPVSMHINESESESGYVRDGKHHFRRRYHKDEVTQEQDHSDPWKTTLKMLAEFGKPEPSNSQGPGRQDLKAWKAKD